MKKCSGRLVAKRGRWITTCTSTVSSSPTTTTANLILKSINSKNNIRKEVRIDPKCQENFECSWGAVGQIVKDCINPSRGVGGWGAVSD